MKRRVKVYFDFADWWVGLYVGEDHLYICVLPTLVVRLCRNNGHEHIYNLGHWMSIGEVPSD